MLLEHIGKNDVAAKIRKAVDLVLEDGSVLTPDIGGTATTIEYEKAIIAHLVKINYMYIPVPLRLQGDFCVTRKIM